jgi:hypothetical protein
MGGCTTGTRINIWSAGGAVTGCMTTGSGSSSCYANGGGGGTFSPASTASSTRCRYVGT